MNDNEIKIIDKAEVTNLEDKTVDLKQGKKRSKLPLVLLAAFILVIASSAFITLRTTIIASLVACIQEGVDNKNQYITFRTLSEEETFSSYKETVVVQIRTDKATAIREQQLVERKELVYDAIKQYCSLYRDAYSFEKERKVEAETAKDQQSFVSGLQIPLMQEEEVKAAENMMSLISLSLHYAMASDSYYKDIPQQDVHRLMDEFAEALDSSIIVEDYYMEQITPGEYDPRPERRLAEKYENEIKSAKENEGSDTYDYILTYHIDYRGSQDEVLIGMETVSVVGEKSFAVIETDISIPEEYNALLAYGSVSTYGGSNVVVQPQTPYILSEEEMQKKADKLAFDFQKALTFDGNAKTVLDLYIDSFGEVFTSESKNNDTDTSEEKESGEISKEESLEISEEENSDKENLENETVQYYEKIQSITEGFSDSMEEQYDVSSEWGTIVFLEEYIYAAQQLAAEIAQDKMILEHPEMLSQEISEEDQKSLKAGINKKKKIILNMPQPDMEKEEVVNDLELSAFQSNYPVESRSVVPEVLLEKVFTYTYNEIGTMEIGVILTQQGVYVTHINMIWEANDSETFILEDIDTDLYSKPNLPRMKREAEEAVSREDYDDQESYDLAISRWLYNNYPDYYENPDQSNIIYNGQASLYYKNSFDKLIKDTSENLYWAYQDLGYLTEGTIFGYLFTPNGGFRNFADDVSDFASETKEAISEIGSAVKDWWKQLW